MAQAPAELRDDLAAGPGKPPPGQADDLLSQLADTEIDRLLADADLDGEPGPGSRPAGRRAGERRGGRSDARGRAGGGSTADPASADSAPAGRAGTADAGDGSPSDQESAAALAGADAMLAKELDQVFDRQLDDAAGPRTVVGPPRDPPREPRPPVNAPTSPPEPLVVEPPTEVPATAEPSAVAPPVVPPTAVDEAREAGGDASMGDVSTSDVTTRGAPEGGAGADDASASETAAVSEAAVGDLLARLSDGERPPPPAEGSIVVPDPSLEVSHGDTATSPHAAADPPAPAHAFEATAAAPTAGAGHAPPAGDHPPAAPRPAVVARAVDGHAAADQGGHSEVIHLPAQPRGPSWADKLLSVLAVPLDPFPDAARDAVGKVAIITAVNGVAVLLYVLFFRG